MKRILVFVFLMLVISCHFAAPSSAQGLLGKRYAGVEVGMARLDEDTNAFLLAGGVRLPVYPKVDVLISGGYSTFEYEHFRTFDVTGTQASVGISLNTKPCQDVNPFVTTDVLYLGRDVEPWDPWDFPDFSAFGLAFGLGFEFVVGTGTALTPSLGLVSIWATDRDVNDTSGNLNLVLSQWFTDSIGGVLSVGTEFSDDDDAVYACTVGLAYGF